MQHILEKARKIRLVVFDVDGVLTDGSLYLSDSGEEIKAFNSHDGHGIKMLRASGVKVAIITGRESRCVDLKAKDLGITLVYQGAKTKLPAFEALLKKLELDASACAYVGDDLIDLPVMLRCGLAVCVPAAPALVKKHAHYVTRLGGGRGAAREICEMVMRAQDTLDVLLATYLK
ncbi:MAG: 3-deoxy-manno-octulosonate-8-phosphatase KdsC [Nitrosospira sp.]|nr:3-deoxy-manno-octulosonate-8-phosphatase KdsC [Nitrosospira sp.]MDN5881395.1 3-deoxy-manno-octulosonate-8-phosphatase KdsC [Nitrosospira sp.]MDN5934602.1 3-deoxy-manno-octulosonate-8-phosphatase KdsC [Nitrosospira sp.]